MKKNIPFLLLFFICSVLQTNAQTNIKNKANILEGIWLFKSQKTSDKPEMGFVPMNTGILKIISSDGKFTNFTPNPYKIIIGTDGLCHVKSDSIYVESVQHSVIPSLIGKDNRLIYKLHDNFLYLKFFLEKNAINQDVNIWIEEIWEKAQMPNQITTETIK
ncbi:DUF4488 domain-containing protein [Flavobacterium undicola]|uniref:DUF4488 domain-containing protein n=1 Tax=Flavobacterium undicola TaxID=1932779 RepID=UPI0013787014|nr:DUF4488 domain-containing protein [Flavobacterium undicola]MBA0884263.1 DUF4488 domain-containing protein [Flavobacterium undicola]